jgi:hypothetical protein
MAVSTNAVKQQLRQNMGAQGADSLANWLEQVQTALAAITAQLDADGGVSGTTFGATLATYVED